MTTSTKTKKDLPLKYKVMADSIRVGKQNAILLDDLMIITGIQDKRSAYQIIESLINQYGYVIGASKNGLHKGYYIPANEKEFKEVIHTFRNAITSMNKRHDNLLINFEDTTKKNRGNLS